MSIGQYFENSSLPKKGVLSSPCCLEMKDAEIVNSNDKKSEAERKLVWCLNALLGELLVTELDDELSKKAAASSSLIRDARSGKFRVLTCASTRRQGMNSRGNTES